jgi:hypothetical protein
MIVVVFVTAMTTGNGGAKQSSNRAARDQLAEGPGNMIQEVVFSSGPVS